jgi:3-dehydroquinate dehydratase/shikimate dehydrogenase
MGKPGVWSRVLAPFYGADFTYASLERGLETAPGQPSISELRRIYEMIDSE